MNLDVTIGSSIIPLEDGTENTSDSYSLGVDILPESPLTVGAEVHQWGLKDNLQVFIYDFHLDYKYANFAFFIAPGMGAVNATDIDTLGPQDNTKSEVQYVKTKISLYDLNQWNLKFYYEKYNFHSDIDGLAADDAVDLFSESTLYLSSHLLSEMMALEGLYEFNDEWKVTLGARYNVDEKHVLEQTRLIYNNTSTLAGGLAFGAPRALDISGSQAPGYALVNPATAVVPKGYQLLVLSDGLCDGGALGFTVGR